MDLNQLSNLQSLPIFRPPWLYLLLLWTMIWKGLALWRAARLGEKPWFVVLFLVNSLGILEILYLFLSKDKKVSYDQA